MPETYQIFSVGVVHKKEEATWIEINLEYMEITMAERKNGQTSRMDFSLYEEDCFERLADVARDAALGKF